MSLDFSEVSPAQIAAEISETSEVQVEQSLSEFELFYEKYGQSTYEEKVGEERIEYPHRIVSGVIGEGKDRRIIIWRSTHGEHATMNLAEAKHIICTFDEVAGERRYEVTDFTQKYFVSRGFDPGQNSIQAEARYLEAIDDDVQIHAATLEIASASDAKWREKGSSFNLEIFT